MSLAFNVAFRGIIQQIEKECGFNRGDITGNTELLKDFTAEVNLAVDDYLDLAIPASGAWQVDDTNTYESDGVTLRDYPIIKTNLVSGQRDYAILTDENGNLILDIFKAAILPSATATEFIELDPFDELNERGNNIISENTTTGVPSRYGKLSNGIFLDIPSSYNATNGLKLFVNREGSYFVYTDTTKKPGFPGIHHEYFALKPSLKYARRNLSASRISELEKQVREYEGDTERRIEGKIQKYFSRREKDVRHIMTGKKINYL